MKTNMLSFRMLGTVVIEIMIGILCAQCIIMKDMLATGKSVRNVKNKLIKQKCTYGMGQMNIILKNYLILPILSQPNAQIAIRVLTWEKRVTAFQEENTFAKIALISLKLSEGHFYRSVGAVSNEPIRWYVAEGQKKHWRKFTFYNMFLTIILTGPAKL